MSFWQDEADLHGLRVKAAFFNAERAREYDALSARVLPFLRDLRLDALCTEGDRRNFRDGALIAQPDAVFEHGDGLISVEYKSVGGRPHSTEKWPSQIRLQDMLQCVVAGYAVAQSTGRLTACVLRCHNACYLLVPRPEVMHEILALIPLAREYHDDAPLISSTDLAHFAVERIRELWPLDDDDGRSLRGRAAHAELLRR